MSYCVFPHWRRALRLEMTFGDRSGFLCVYVGRLSREKQIDVLIKAVRAIPGAYLAIIGKDDDE